MNGLLKGALAAGGGAAGVAVLRRTLFPGARRRYEAWERTPYKDFPNKVLVVGGGFAGYNAVERLCRLARDRDDVGVMLISRENYFTFWPMLASVIGGDVETHNVAQPLRRTLIRLGASFRRADLESVDPERQVVTAAGREFPYDHLVLSLGAQPAYFGIPGVEEHAISIKGIGAGEEICDRVIDRYEETTLAGGEVPDSKLTFVVIGGGATGVEVAAELHNLLQELLVPDYPNIDPDRPKIILIDANKEVLKELDPALRRVAQMRLHDLRIEVINNVKAREVKADRVILTDGREIASENVIWTAGARASKKLDDLPFPTRRTQGPRGRPLYAGRGLRQRVGDRRLRGHRGRERRTRAPQRPGRRAGGRGRRQKHPRRYRRARSPSRSATSRLGSSSSSGASSPSTRSWASSSAGS